MKYRNFFDAYKNLLFEKEAYKFMNDLEYLKKRRKFEWIRGFFSKKNKVHPAIG